MFGSFPGRRFADDPEFSRKEPQRRVHFKQCFVSSGKLGHFLYGCSLGLVYAYKRRPFLRIPVSNSLRVSNDLRAGQPRGAHFKELFVSIRYQRTRPREGVAGIRYHGTSAPHTLDELRQCRHRERDVACTSCTPLCSPSDTSSMEAFGRTCSHSHRNPGMCIRSPLPGIRHQALQVPQVRG